MSKIKTQGTLFKRGDGGTTEVFAAIAQVNEVDLPSPTRTIIDVTSLTDTAKKKLGGLKDYGEVGLQMTFDPKLTAHQDLEADMDNADPRNYEIELTDGSKYRFAGLVKSFKRDLKADNVVRANVGIEISGAVTVMPGV